MDTTFLHLTVLCLAAVSRAARVSFLFNDEFQPCFYSPGCTNGLKDDHWGHDLGDGSDWSSQGWGNQELQCYSSDATAVAAESKGDASGDGLLLIQATSTPGADCHNANVTTKRDYTSARIVTRNKHAFRWTGSQQQSDTIFVEASMKLPEGQGLWPAFWMLPQSRCLSSGPGCGEYGPWCLSGEIDIMESINGMKEVHGTVIHPRSGSTSEERCYRGQGSKHRAKGWSHSFHTFGFSWNATHMNWYINNSRYHHVQYSSLPGANSSAPPSAPYDQPFYLVFNLAVGGTWPGQPESDAIFPAKLLVDWVRVRRLTCGTGDVNETDCSNGIDDDCDGLIDGDDKDCGWGVQTRVMISFVLVVLLVGLYAVWG